MAQHHLHFTIDNSLTEEAFVRKYLFKVGVPEPIEMERYFGNKEMRPARARASQHDCARGRQAPRAESSRQLRAHCRIARRSRSQRGNVLLYSSEWSSDRCSKEATEAVELFLRQLQQLQHKLTRPALRVSAIDAPAGANSALASRCFMRPNHQMKKLSAKQATKRAAPSADQELTNKNVRRIPDQYSSEAQATKMARVGAEMAPRRLQSAIGPISAGYRNAMSFVKDSRPNKYKEPKQQRAVVDSLKAKCVLAPPTAAAPTVLQHHHMQQLQHVQQHHYLPQYNNTQQKENIARAAAAAAMLPSQHLPQPGPSTAPRATPAFSDSRSYAAAAAAMQDNALGNIFDEEPLVGQQASPYPSSSSSSIASLLSGLTAPRSTFAMPGDRRSPNYEMGFSNCFSIPPRENRQ